MNGHFPVCELIMKTTLDPNPKDQDGWTPLLSAAQNGHLRVCKLILSNIFLKTLYYCDPLDNWGHSPIKLAAQFCHEKVKTAIIETILDAEERKITKEDTAIRIQMRLNEVHN